MRLGDVQFPPRTEPTFPAAQSEPEAPVTKAKVIRYHLEEFRTVLRLAYNDATWRRMVNDYGGPGDVPDDAPAGGAHDQYPLPADPPDSAGRVDRRIWHPQDRPDLNPKRVQHLLIYINLWDGRRTRTAGDTGDLVGTIAHEATHVVQFILDFIGEGAEQNHRVNEVEGYLTGFVARWVWDHLP